MSDLVPMGNGNGRRKETAEWLFRTGLTLLVAVMAFFLTRVFEQLDRNTAAVNDLRLQVVASVGVLNGRVDAHADRHKASDDRNSQQDQKIERQDQRIDAMQQRVYSIPTGR